MNHAGEIDALTRQVRPDIAIITTVDVFLLMTEKLHVLSKDRDPIKRRENICSASYLASKAKEELERSRGIDKDGYDGEPGVFVANGTKITIPFGPGGKTKLVSEKMENTVIRSELAV